MSRSPRAPSSRQTSIAPAGDDGLAKFACEECRRRKLKCSRDLPACAFCVEHHKERGCTYTVVVRTPLTRRNLDAAERRIAELEAQIERRRDRPPQQHATSFSQSTVLTPPASGTNSGPQPSPQSAMSSMSPAAPFMSIATASGAPDVNPGPSGSEPSCSPGNLLPPMMAVQRAELSSQGSIQQSPTLSGVSTAAYGYGSMGPPASSSAADPASTPAPQSHPDADGTGSLTVDETSGGYLGSLSGATLLHFLQRCAADVNLAAKGSGRSIVESPASTIASNAPLAIEQVQRFTDAYFRVYHVQYPLVHEATYRAQLAEIIPRTGGAAWNLLHQVILGIGSMCVLGDMGDGSDTLRLYDRATSAVNAALFGTSSLTSVQAFVLLGNYAQKLNHPSAGSVFLGIALRMAINLGLHIEAASASMTPFEREIRRRVWFTLFVFDCGAALTFGHPSTMPTTGVEVLLPVNVSDMTFTPATLIRPFGIDAPTPNSSLIYQTFFHQVANNIIAELTAQPQLPAKDALRLCHDLDALQQSLPAYFSHSDPQWFEFARHKIAWRLENLRMVILRSTFLRVSLGQTSVSSEEELCWDKCVACAAEVVRSVQSFTEHSPRSSMEWWYALHFIFPATFIPLIALRVRPASPMASDWLFVVHSASSCLQRCHHALLKGLADRCLGIISAVANLQPQGSSSQLSYPQAGQQDESAEQGHASQMFRAGTEDVTRSTSGASGDVMFGATAAAAGTGPSSNSSNAAGPPPLDVDFTHFLEMLSGTGETHVDAYGGGFGMPATALHAPGLMTDLDLLSSWFQPNGAEGPL